MIHLISVLFAVFLVAAVKGSETEIKITGHSKCCKENQINCFEAKIDIDNFPPAEGITLPNSMTLKPVSDKVSKIPYVYNLQTEWGNNVTLRYHPMLNALYGHANTDFRSYELQYCGGDKYFWHDHGFEVIESDSLPTLQDLGIDVDDDVSNAPFLINGTEIGSGSMTTSSKCQYENKKVSWKKLGKSKVDNKDACEKECKETEDCKYWFVSKKNFCVKFGIVLEDKEGFTSGQLECSATVSNIKKDARNGSCKCGLARRKRRVTGGQETEINEYPWQVGLYRYRQIICGGSLISDRWILTAAHCVDDLPRYNPSSFWVILTEHDRSTWNEAPFVYSRVSEVVNHPRYRFPDNDIALLKMPQAVDFNQYPQIRPICLPPNNGQTYAGKDAVLTGWGKRGFNTGGSVVLQEVTVKVLANRDCFWYPDSGILCAGNGYKGSCRGDSGGPLIYSPGNGETPGQNYELIGTVSFGYIRCGYPDIPDGYTRTTSQLNWIESVTSGTLNTCPRT